jgi:DNA-3-methyladenine glycosylase
VRAWLVTRSLERSFFARDAVLVAPDLLGKVMVHGDRAIRIVEVEAYCGANDPASHARNGSTPRSRVMFGPPGYWYVYFTYGMHWCANVVCGDPGEAAAVLIRAGEPVEGVDAMFDDRRAARRAEDLCSGPAKLCQALGVDGHSNATDVVDGHLRIVDGTPVDPSDVVATGRVGVSDGGDLPWRWLVADSPHVSRPSPRGRRVGKGSHASAGPASASPASAAQGTWQ